MSARQRNSRSRINFQLSNDFHPVRVMKGYLESDKALGEFAVLMEWDNLYYTKPSKKPSATKSVVRLGLIK